MHVTRKLFQGYPPATLTVGYAHENCELGAREINPAAKGVSARHQSAEHLYEQIDDLPEVVVAAVEQELSIGDRHWRHESHLAGPRPWGFLF
jgi:hypothetical protein